MQYKVGDVVKVKNSVWQSMGIQGDTPEGPIVWIHPAGVHRAMIKGSGWQFKQEDLEFLWVDVDVSEFE